MGKKSEFVTVDELCERWQKGYIDILYLIKNEKLKWYTQDSIQYDTIDDEVRAKYKKECELSELFEKPSDYSDKIITFKFNLEKEKKEKTEKITVDSLKSGDYYFKRKDIDLYEKEHPELIQKKKKSIDTSLTFLDPKNKYFSEELSIAIETWKAWFGPDGIIHKDEGKSYKVKYRIAEWIKKNHKNLTENTIDRIATMVNPFREGGAPPTKKHNNS